MGALFTFDFFLSFLCSPHFLDVTKVLKSGKLPTDFQKSSVQAREVYQPVGGGETHISVFKRVQ
jgi:hypothetical protein